MRLISEDKVNETIDKFIGYLDEDMIFRIKTKISQIPDGAPSVIEEKIEAIARGFEICEKNDEIIALTVEHNDKMIALALDRLLGVLRSRGVINQGEYEYITEETKADKEVKRNDAKTSKDSRRNKQGF